MLVQHPPGSFTPRNLCEPFPLGAVTVRPPPLWIGSRWKLIKASWAVGDKAGKEKEERGTTGGKYCYHQVIVPFPSLWSTSFPFLRATLPLLGQAPPGTSAVNWGLFWQPGIFLELFSSLGKRGLMQSSKLEGDLELHRHGGRAGWHLPTASPGTRGVRGGVG